MDEQEENELGLRDYLRVVARRRGVILLSAVVVTGAALFASLLQTPVYSAEAKILLQPRSTESLFDPKTGQQNDPERGVQTEIEVLRSRPVRDAVAEKLGTAPDVSVSPVGQTDVIAVKAESTNADQAAIVANAYAREYIAFRRKQAVDDLVSAGNEIQAKIVDLQRQIDATSPSSADRRESLLQQQALFKQKQDQLQVDSALKSGGAQLVNQASPPPSPVKPTPVQTGAVALAVGLTFGVGLAFLFEYLDDSIKGEEGLQRSAEGLPTLGLIPAVAGWKERKRPMVASLSEPKSAAAEAYRALRTSIQFMGLDRSLKTIQVTSPNAGEGKTTTICNLAVALAQMGTRVVIVSCDLRRPRVHEFLGLPNTAGFTSVLLGEVPISGALHRVTGLEGLSVITSGPIPPNPSELLASRRTVEALAALQAEADIVLIDSPPILPVTDAAVLANRVDGTLLVATAGETTRREFRRAHDVLRQVDAHLLGSVLNGVSGDAAYGYSYGYRYAYAYAEESTEPNGRRSRQTATPPFGFARRG